MTQTVAETQAFADFLGTFVSPQTPTEVAQKLERFVQLLVKWNRVYNLTAITDPHAILTHHLLDSLAIVRPLDQVVADRTAPALLDVGSGAGLPGLPLAIIRPTWSLTLIDTSSKKAAFIQQATAELSLANVRVVTRRVESYTDSSFDVIVSRAFSSLNDFVGKTRHLLQPAGAWAAMKGRVPHAEIAELPHDIECCRIERLKVPGLDAERHLLLLKVKS